MKIRFVSKLLVAVSIVFTAACVEGIPQARTPLAECQNGSANPECDAFCEDNPDHADCAPDSTKVFCDATCVDGQNCDQTRSCAACRTDDDCTDGVCFEAASPDDNVCAACIDSSDCTDPGAARCAEGATPAETVCAECNDSAQCAGIAGLEACDIDSGTCVECADATDCVTDGTAFACDLRDNTCSDIEVESVGGCEPCVSNSSCAPGNFCVELTYQGTARGYYCMPVFDPVAASCPRPYGASPKSRRTLGGESEQVCLIKEELTTCEAIDQFEVNCPIGDECTADGSRCEDFEGIARCSYACTGDVDCKNSIVCDDGEDEVREFCGG